MVVVVRRQSKLQGKIISYRRQARQMLEPIDEDKSLQMIMKRKHRRRKAFDDTIFAKIVFGELSIPPSPRMATRIMKKEVAPTPTEQAFQKV